MPKQYDVVIVGAGPAGLMTARTVGESGLKIALIERKTDISKIHRTDGGVVAINEYLFGQVVTFNRSRQILVFPVGGFSVQYKGPWNDNRYGFHFYSPGGRRFMVGDWAALKQNPVKNSKGVALSKGRLLQGILSEAQALGVDFFPDTNVVGVKTGDGRASVITNKGDFEGRFVVAADGINSRIVQLLGLNKMRKFSGTSRSLCWVMAGVKPPDAEGHIFIFTMYGTFSIMPICRPDHFHLCIINDDPQKELESLLERLTDQDPVFSKWFTGAKKVDAIESSVANSWEAIEKPYANNVILVGDACWSEQFATPPALSAGYQAGHALTRAFVDEKFNEEGVAQYLEWYDTYCFKPYGRLPMGGGVNLVDYLTAEELDYLAALPEKAAPSTGSFLKMFRTVFETYQPLIPRIRQERPEILAKFKKMGEDMEKAQTARRKAGFANK